MFAEDMMIHVPDPVNMPSSILQTLLPEVQELMNSSFCKLPWSCLFHQSNRKETNIV